MTQDQYKKIAEYMGDQPQVFQLHKSATETEPVLLYTKYDNDWNEIMRVVKALHTNGVIITIDGSMSMEQVCEQILLCV